MSMHQRALSDVVIRNMAKSYETYLNVVWYLDGLQHARWPRSYVDVFFQRTAQDVLSFDYAYVFGLVHCGICDGSIVRAQIDKGCVPFPDRCISENNQVLNRDGSIFRGSFAGGTDDADGYFEWVEKIYFDKNSNVRSQVEVPPDRVPLEVGITKPSRTLLHLVQERAIARWPYGSESIFVLKVINDDWMRSGDKFSRWIASSSEKLPEEGV
jgi:hypothetical protein